MARQLTGTVVSDKMNKTIVVEVERVVQHPLYKKRIRRHKRLYAGDEERKAKEGDIVVVEEVRPLSKTKRWRLITVVEQAPEANRRK